MSRARPPASDQNGTIDHQTALSLGQWGVVPALLASVEAAGNEISYP
jgi:hypothetical protein